jgi:Fe-S cluster assembly iron-binding protein IscA
MKLTENALLQFKKMIEENENHSSGVRFFTFQGCCSPSLQMEIAPSPKENDVVVTMGDVDFFVTPDADNILSTLTIDFSDGTFRTVRV